MHQTATAPPFDPPHGGYPGDVIAHEEYLACCECGWGYPLEENEACSNCGNPDLEPMRVRPAPESTIPAWRFQ